MFKNKKLVRIYDFQKLFQIVPNSSKFKKYWENKEKKKWKNEKIRFPEMTFSGNLWLEKEIHIRKIIIFLKIRVKISQKSQNSKNFKKNKQIIRKNQFSTSTFNRKFNNKINNFSKPLFWHSWIPRANFRQKIKLWIFCQNVLTELAQTLGCFVHDQF